MSITIPEGWERGFKVVNTYRVTPDGTQRGFFSFSRYACDGGREYRIGRKVMRRKGYGPYGVFATYEESRAFLRDMRHSTLYSSTYPILPCAYKPSEDKGFWNAKGETYKAPYPKGTVFADAVMLLSDKEEPHESD